MEGARSAFGNIDLLVSNAGVASGVASRGRAICDTDIEEFSNLGAVHVLGPVRVVQALIPDLRAAPQGDVVLVSSETVDRAPACAAPYTMAKAALETFARTWPGRSVATVPTSTSLRLVWGAHRDGCSPGEGDPEGRIDRRAGRWGPVRSCVSP